MLWKQKFVVNAKKEKPISEFGKNKAKKDGLQAECKECKSAYNKLHYQKNRETYLAKARESSKECEDYIREIKSSLKCSICGEDRWWVLDFHHENPDEKESCIATLAHNGSRKKMEEELKKCIVLCANCHRDIHFKIGTITIPNDISGGSSVILVEINGMLQELSAYAEEEHKTYKNGDKVRISKFENGKYYFN